MSLTQIQLNQWTTAPGGYRRWKRKIYLGSGETLWERSCDALLHWEIKTRSGFTVTGQPRVAIGAHPELRVRLGPMSIDEPIEVVDVIEESSRVGFAYKTLSGHPVSGEEAFILVREQAGIFLVIRSLTAPSDHLHWRIIFPLLLLAQKYTRRRYATALLREPS